MVVNNSAFTTNCQTVNRREIMEETPDKKRITHPASCSLIHDKKRRSPGCTWDPACYLVNKENTGHWLHLSPQHWMLCLAQEVVIYLIWANRLGLLPEGRSGLAGPIDRLRLDYVYSYRGLGAKFDPSSPEVPYLL